MPDLFRCHLLIFVQNITRPLLAFLFIRPRGKHPPIGPARRAVHNVLQVLLYPRELRAPRRNAIEDEAKCVQFLVGKARKERVRLQLGQFGFRRDRRGERRASRVPDPADAEGLLIYRSKQCIFQNIF